MNKAVLGLDAYDMKARFIPAVCLILPMAQTAFFIFPDSIGMYRLFGLLIPPVFGAICVDWVSLKGKKLELSLFEKWGGRPSELNLSYMHSAYSELALDQIHTKLANNVPGTSNITKSQEASDFENAIETYGVWSDWLRTVNRSKKETNLVFDSNIRYGRARNLLALRGYGLFFSFAAVLVNAVLITRTQVSVANLSVLSGFVLPVCLLLFWWKFVTEESVRFAADRYAKRLIESVNDDSKGSKKRATKSPTNADS